MSLVLSNYDTGGCVAVMMTLMETVTVIFKSSAHRNMKCFVINRIMFTSHNVEKTDYMFNYFILYVVLK